jgi:hypothetical protein
MPNPYALVKYIAERTGADQRTVVKALAGLPVRGAAGRSIAREMRDLGVDATSVTFPNAPPPPRAA